MYIAPEYYCDLSEETCNDGRCYYAECSKVMNTLPLAPDSYLNPDYSIWPGLIIFRPNKVAYNTINDTQINLPRRVWKFPHFLARFPKYKCAFLNDLVIVDTGEVFDEDEDGFYWTCLDDEWRPRWEAAPSRFPPPNDM